MCVCVKLLLSTKKFTVKRCYFWHPSCEMVMPFLTPFLLSWLSAMSPQVSPVQTTLEHHVATSASSRVLHSLQPNTEGQLHNWRETGVLGEGRLKLFSGRPNKSW